MKFISKIHSTPLELKILHNSSIIDIKFSHRDMYRLTKKISKLLPENIYILIVLTQVVKNRKLTRVKPTRVEKLTSF